MGLPKAVSEDQQGDEEDVSHDDIMALLRTMQDEQRSFRKEVNGRLEAIETQIADQDAKLDAIETHNMKQDAHLARGAQHMLNTDTDLGMLAQYMHSTQAVKDALQVMERTFIRLRASSARSKATSDENVPTNPSNPKPETTDHIDTIPAPSPDSETGG